MAQLILIGGGSCAGKTSIANLIKDLVDPKTVLLISQDNYFNDYSRFSEIELESENFDKPEAFKLMDLRNDVLAAMRGDTISLPIYNFQKRLADKTQVIETHFDIIIIEGIFGLIDEELNRRSLIRIFVEADEHLTLERRIQRDTVQRSFSRESIIKRYRTFVMPGYQKYVLPSRKNANYIVSGNLIWNKQALLESVLSALHPPPH